MSDVRVASARAAQPELTPNRLHQRYAAAFRPRSLFYWCDLLGSAAVGWGLFALATQLPVTSPLYVVATLGATFALLRTALFIHELAHLKASQMPHFEAVWNAVFGLPFLIPSLMYVGSHQDHHRRTGFGTERDPEYAPIARWPRLRIALFVVTVALVPLAMPIRWGLLGPLSRLFPGLRRVVVERMSTLVINTGYRRPLPHGRSATRWAWQEAATALTVWAVAAAAIAGWIPVHVLAQWWLVGAGILVVNQVRTLAAHGYENDGEPVDSEGQLLDSINLTGGSPLNALIAPVGLRYHALHHYLPSLPYHSLGTVHRRLLAELSPDSPYRRTLRPGLVAVLQKLWCSPGLARKRLVT